MEKRRGYLPRLEPEFYQGDAAVFWTLPIFHRATGWLNDSLHQRFREMIMHACAREGLLCLVYCLMPDHMHFVWMGLRVDSDQKNGMAFFRTYMEKKLAPHKFQVQAHDRVLSDDERQRGAFAAACRYVLEDPVRDGLVTDPRAWNYMGTVLPGYPEVHPLEADFWPVFWKVYQNRRDPKAAHRKLPFRHSQCFSSGRGNETEGR